MDDIQSHTWNILPVTHRALAKLNGYELNFNREIVGLGLSNFAGALSNCYTTTGSFSRSAVNNNAGAVE